MSLRGFLNLRAGGCINARCVRAGDGKLRQGPLTDQPGRERSDELGS